VFHSWLSSEHDDVLLEIRNQNEENCLWSLVATTSLNLTVMSLQRCKKLSDTSITMLSLVRSFWLRTTGVSITPTKHTPWCLGYHQSLSLWFRKWLWTLPSSFLPRCGVNADLTLRLVPICKFSSMVGMILTLELRKWSCLCSCHLDQRCGSMTILCFLGPLFLRNLGTRFLLWGGGGYNTSCYGNPNQVI
jgi:hypothetical protein